LLVVLAVLELWNASARRDRRLRGAATPFVGTRSFQCGRRVRLATATSGWAALRSELNLLPPGSLEQLLKYHSRIATGFFAGRILVLTAHLTAAQGDAINKVIAKLLPVVPGAVNFRCCPRELENKGVGKQRWPGCYQ